MHSLPIQKPACRSFCSSTFIFLNITALWFPSYRSYTSPATFIFLIGRFSLSPCVTSVHHTQAKLVLFSLLFAPEPRRSLQINNPRFSETSAISSCLSFEPEKTITVARVLGNCLFQIFRAKIGIR